MIAFAQWHVMLDLYKCVPLCVLAKCGSPLQVASAAGLEAAP